MKHSNSTWLTIYRPQIFTIHMETSSLSQLATRLRSSLSIETLPNVQTDLPSPPEDTPSEGLPLALLQGIDKAPTLADSTPTVYRRPSTQKASQFGPDRCQPQRHMRLLEEDPFLRIESLDFESLDLETQILCITNLPEKTPPSQKRKLALLNQFAKNPDFQKLEKYTQALCLAELARLKSKNSDGRCSFVGKNFARIFHNLALNSSVKTFTKVPS